MPGAPQTASRFVIRLPAIHVWYREDGVLTLGEVSTDDLYRQLGVDLRFLNLRPDALNRLVQAKVQTLEFVQTPSGVAGYVNGEPLPAVAWDASTLGTLGDFLPVVDGLYVTVVARLLPVLQFTQTHLVVHFPAAGASAGLAETSKPLAGAAAAPGPSAVARMEIAYDEQGNPSLVHFEGPAWARWGIQVKPLALRPHVVRRLMEANIQHLRFISRPDGLSIYVNNRPLPRLVWDEASFSRALGLYLTAAGVGDPELRAALERLAGLLLQAEVDILCRFPVKGGAVPIPVLEPPDK